MGSFPGNAAAFTGCAGNLDAAGNYTNIPDASGNFNAINVEWLGWDFALELRALVAILFLIAGVMLFIGLGLVYNLDKKTLAKMNADLAIIRAGEAKPVTPEIDR